MALAPIALFTYNRPTHTSQTLKSLMKNGLAKESELFIFSDGPKENASPEERKSIEVVREIIRKEKWCKTVHYIEAKSNKGLAESIISGVSTIVNKYGKVIVLEDDMLCSNFFLQFMNEALTMYEQEEKVMGISGYVVPASAELPQTFFIKGADCWGWGTWQRSWSLFERDGEKLLSELKKKKLTAEFDFDNSYPYTQMLVDQIEKKNDSWAIRWYASAFLMEKYFLFPGKSFIRNIGNDGSGFHQLNSGTFDVQLADEFSSLTRMPAQENLTARKLIENYFRTLQHNERLATKLMRKTNTLLKKIFSIS